MQTLTLPPSQFSVSIKRRAKPFEGTPCKARDTSGGAQTAALAAYSTLNTSSATATTVINQNPLGRYADSGSCGYDCSYEQDWNWWADYRPTNTNLINAVAFINCGGAYNNAFQPTQKWVGTDMPTYGTALLADINAGNFTDANTVLQNNLNEANSGLQTIASFVTYENQYIGYLQTTATNSHNWIVTNATNCENDLIGKISCGAGDVQNSFNNMFNDITAKYANMAVPFNTVNANFQVALQAVEAVAGVFLSLQSKSSLVSQNLTTAQTYPSGSAMRQVYLNMAIENWNDFVAEANTQLTA